MQPRAGEFILLLCFLFENIGRESTVIQFRSVLYKQSQGRLKICIWSLHLPVPVPGCISPMSLKKNHKKTKQKKNPRKDCSLMPWATPLYPQTTMVYLDTETRELVGYGTACFVAEEYSWTMVQWQNERWEPYENIAIIIGWRTRRKRKQGKVCEQRHLRLCFVIAETPCMQI